MHGREGMHVGEKATEVGSMHPTVMHSMRLLRPFSLDFHTRIIGYS